MTLNEREAIVAQIEEFKKDAMELWFVPELAASYQNMDMFSYSIVGNNEVFFMREQARQLWSFWNKDKAQAVPDTHMLVEKKNTEDWYLDEDEGLWLDHDGIDGTLCELGIGEVKPIKHKEYLITQSNTLYAARVWDDNDDHIAWKLFDSEAIALEAAKQCKSMYDASESGAEG
ncbi:hypothetical protein [Acinetobacter baumannii]|uniref:hypothetical protein n=1 Tax=Acinetobacter baumannii TaxID=470 RepID=UPI001D190E84|nr:hypothetical protein [Acinetobacter baumannii]